MIVLDTNVLSELMRPAPSLYTTSITQAEILHGLMLLSRGRRRNALEAAATSMFAEDFGGRILGGPVRAVSPDCGRSAILRSGRAAT